MRRSIQNETTKHIYDNSIARKIETEVFPRTRELLVQFLEQKLPEGEVRDNLIFKVKHIEFDGFDCSPIGQNLASDLQPNAFYYPGGNSISYCLGSLFYTSSLFSIVHTISHELGHAIDPCNIENYIDSRKYTYQYASQRDKENEYPLPGLIDCLRGSESAQAQHLALTPQMPPQVPVTPFNAQPTFPSLPPGPSPAQEAKTFEFCQKRGSDGNLLNADQIGESVSDWIAAEILPAYIENYYPGLTETELRSGYINALKPGCRTGHFEQQSSGFDIHPELRTRVNKILLVNPKVRQHMGCGEVDSNSVYCSLGSNRSTVPNSPDQIPEPPSVESPNPNYKISYPTMPKFPDAQKSGGTK